jgi:hypothetical protein
MYQHQQASPEKFTKNSSRKREGFGKVTGKVVERTFAEVFMNNHILVYNVN